MVPMSAECEHHLAIWREWQRSHTGEEPPPDVATAIAHIVSCEECFEKIPHLSYSLFLETTEGEQNKSLAALMKTAQQRGIEVAAVQNPAAANYLAKNERTFDRTYAFSQAAQAGFSGLSLPADIAYTVARQLSSPTWAGRFTKHFGISEQGELKKRANAAFEFSVDRDTAQSQFNLRPIEGFTPSTSETVRVRLRDKSQPRKKTEGVPPRRLVTVTAGNLQATVDIDSQQGLVTVILPDQPRYHAQPPVIALLFETGKVTSSKTNLETGGYQTTFSGLQSGNYVVAIDVVDRMKAVEKPQLPTTFSEQYDQESQKQRRKDTA